MLKNPQNLDFAESEERGGKTQKQTEFVLSISLLSEQVTLDCISLFRRFAPYKSDSRHHAARRHKATFNTTSAYACRLFLRLWLLLLKSYRFFGVAPAALIQG